MASHDRIILGLDVGSVSVDLVVMDEAGGIAQEHYIRHKGHPMRVVAETLGEVIARYGTQAVIGLAATGAGGRVIADLLRGTFVNEVVAQAAATAALYPHVRTIVEIGGEDSKLIALKRDGDRSEVADFAMNTMCAAGTGSFLDQQATRLGLTIEEFGQMALESANPPRVAGRCSVFAKSDMIHLQQKATPVHDIVAGLCVALARNFKSTVGSAAPIEPPVSFHGGVAANPGIRRALAEVLELEGDDFQVPQHFAMMGAIGAVLRAMASGLTAPDLSRISDLRNYQAPVAEDELKPLKIETSVIMPAEVAPPKAGSGKIAAYLGVDVGSISTNVVVIDVEGNVLSKRYLMTAGRPLEAVRRGLLEVGEEVGDLVEILGACTTGSGRYLTADFIGADVVRNEITAQARGALAIDPTVDTIFEIGGQDSKYICLENGAVVDFEMNKVCAAGTGSFLEEQAEKLGISIKEEFARLALQSQNPINLGERCTVFMESELQKSQQSGAAIEDLVAGLAYSIVYNYLNRVVAQKKVGSRIFFQGGTAFNKAIVAAFERVTGKPITVPAHNEVTGALGCALIARECDEGRGSRFKGFDLTKKGYEIVSFECQDCANHCEINEVRVEGEEPLYYGSRCEKFDVDRRAARKAEGVPDLFAERAKLLASAYTPSAPVPDDAPRVGFPRAGLFFDLYPFWHAFLTELGVKVVLSDRTNKRIIHTGAEASVAETCFPMKVLLGHLINLLGKDVDFIWLPSVINLPAVDPGMTDSFVCPYMQSAAYTVKSSVEFADYNVELLEPAVYLALNRKRQVEALTEVGRRFGKGRGEVARALEAADRAQARFNAACQARGAEILAGLGPDQRGIVIVGRSYNTADPGANLELPRKLRNMGELAIPMDFLPLDSVRLPSDWFNMYWRSGQRILSAAEVIAHDPRLFALYLTNFGCGPDSFITRFFNERLGEKPSLVIEVDEHSADAGIITRCEAFLDSLEANRGRQFSAGRHFRPLNIEAASKRTVLIPNMSAHAYGLAAAFKACGMPAEVLDEADEETLFWGRQYTSGKECFPCIVTTGDMVKYAKRPDFDRDKYAFFMGGSGGPCRFGQYNALQRMVLDDLGFEDVPIFAPNQASSFYDDMGIVGRKFLRLGWQGIVAVDLLEKALFQSRPYEVEPGSAERAFWASVDDVCMAIENTGELSALVAALSRSRERFAAVEVERSEQRPLIGLVGEFYVRAHAFSNQDLVRQIERLGGEVWSAPVYEWFLYRNFRRDMRAKLKGDHLLRLRNTLTDRVMKSDEHKMLAAFDGFLQNAHEPRTETVLDYAAPYIHRSFEGEAIMTVGKGIDFARKGLAGIVSVMPFTCMPGTISHAIMKRVRRNEDEFPFLNMVYDGLEQSTALTRLEAFMHQAKEYARRRAGVQADLSGA